MNAKSRYNRGVPPYHGLRGETVDERLMKMRYQPTGDVVLWVQNGPEGAASRARDGAAAHLSGHRHVADESGADCAECGFPWWPTEPGRDGEQ